MARNEVRTDFIGDPKSLFAAADAVEARLKSLGSLAVNPTFGGNAPLAAENLKTLKESLAAQNSLAQAEKLNEQLKRATLATEKEQLSVESARLSLASKQERAITAAPKLGAPPQKLEPTVSLYWEREAEKVTASVNKIEQATKRVGYQSVGFGIDDSGKITGSPQASGALKTAVKQNPLVDSAKLYGESRFNDTVAGIRNIGSEAEKTGEKIVRLRGRTTELQRTFLELADDFAPRGTNRPFNAVGRELFGLYNATSESGGIDAAARAAALTRVKETGIAVAKAEKAVIAASAAADLGSAAAKQTATAASVSLTVAKRAETAATAALAAAETESTLALLGPIAAIGAAAAAGAAIVYHITSDIRAEAERRLKVENDITAAVNKQILSANELARSFAEQRSNAARSDSFAQFTKTDSLEELNARKKSLEAIVYLTRNAEQTGGTTDDSKALINDAVNARRELLAVDQRIRDVSREKDKSASDSFNQSFISSDKSNNDRLESEKRYNARLKDYNDKRAAEAKKASDKLQAEIGKINELGKQYKSTFEDLFLKSDKNNPFVSIFSEGDRAVDKLRENLKDLKPELRAIAEQMQQKLNSDSVFNARLDNDLGAYDLRSQAKDLRDFKAPKIADTSKFFSDFIEDGLKQIKAANGGGFTQYNRLANGGTIETDARNGLLNVYDRVANGATISRSRTFADLSEKEKFDFVNKDNVSLQQRLSGAFDLAQNRKALNDEQQSAIDRKIVSLASGARPEQLTDRQRDLVATSLEKEAARRDSYERKANELRAQQLAIQTETRDFIKELRDKAQTAGKQAVDINLKNASDFDASAETRPLAPTPSAKITETFYSEYQNQ